MVNPPPHPAQIPIWVWLQRVQVAAALIIACLDHGWQGSVRRRVLLSLARGPMDWTIEAAIIALAQIAQEEASAVGEITKLFENLALAQPSPGAVPYLSALVVCGLQLPGLPRNLKKSLEEIQGSL
jgi:hypothetical protein